MTAGLFVCACFVRFPKYLQAPAVDAVVEAEVAVDAKEPAADAAQAAAKAAVAVDATAFAETEVGH